MNGVVNVVEKAGHVSQAQSRFQNVNATHNDSMYFYFDQGYKKSSFRL